MIWWVTGRPGCHVLVHISSSNTSARHQPAFGAKVLVAGRRNHRQRDMRWMLGIMVDRIIGDGPAAIVIGLLKGILDGQLPHAGVHRRAADDAEGRG
jgi:hypothetical protein